MRWIYISPHLDDAVLSAGGLIYEQTCAGQQVEIWTILCGFPPGEELSPYAQLLHHEWGVPSVNDLIHARREEDRKACQIVGATPVHFDDLDCIYRRANNGDWLYGYIFLPPHQDEQDFPARIAKTISARLRPDNQLVCPLGLGAHVDHVLVRRAVDLLQRTILYYLDVPYLFKTPEEFASSTAGMKAKAYKVSEAGLKSWQEAISAYASQVGQLFGSQDAMREQIHQYWLENGGIRLWSFD